jgi:hypothetical protein
MAPTCLTLPITSAPVPQPATAPSQTSTWTSPGWRRAQKRQQTITAPRYWGGCSTELIIKVAITGGNVLGHGPLTMGCNNMGVVQHGNSPWRPMLEKQPQSVVLRYFKGLMALSRIGGRMHHVYGHADEYLLEAEMSPAQRVNCWADKLATLSLMAMVETYEFISSMFPPKRSSQRLPGNGLRGPPKMQSLSFGESRWCKYFMTDGGGGG